jgi:glycerophosphoryl diester phosphodiesterase
MKRLALLLAAAATFLALPAAPAPATTRPAFDLQAHRGGMALRPESTLPAFAHALRIGVSTLELDVQITQDGEAVVTHDRQVNPVVCQDTAPATPGDPEFPYVGKYVNTLTLAQVKTLDCGTRRPRDPRTDRYLPTLVMRPGERMATLDEVFALVRRNGARHVGLNIETKVEAGAPQETAPREQFVQVVARKVRRARFLRRVTIQSFDWGALMRMREVEPRLPIVALTVPNFLQVGQAGASPWLGGLDIDDFGGDPVAAVDSFGADVISPLHGEPQDAAVYWPDYVPFTTKEMVDRAHARGIRVIPWTVDDRPTMEKLMDDGVDGIITNHPDRLREVMADRGYRLPPRVPHARPR